MCTDNITQVVDRLLSKAKFGQFNQPLVLGKQFKNLSEVLNMVFIRGAVHKDVIEKHQGTLAKEWM